MGEAYRKLHGLDKPRTLSDERITVTLSLHPCAWARLKLLAETDRELNHVAAHTWEAMGKAIVAKEGDSSGSD